MSKTVRAFTAESGDQGFRRGVVDFPVDELPADGVLVDVAYSSVNYKDALAASEKGRVARISPLVVGIDLAGTVRESDDPMLAPGTEVLAHGYELGVSRHGGFAEVARVPAEWVVSLPAGLSAREAMTVGTAGYTAALSVLALVDHGIKAADGPVLVTGATGGVGSIAVEVLAGLGYDVVASTGKADAEPYLRALGAREVLDREQLTDVAKPVQSATWAGCVDSVGGVTLAHVLATLLPGGAVAASGNVGGAELPTTVLPFILRGVTLYGIDSVTTPIERRRAVWERIATDLKPRHLDHVEQVVALDALEDALDEITRGQVTGRYLVDVRS
jgi:acrylyl-CoA reductase (NADPH)